MEEETKQIPCPKCNFPILTSFNFCPNCGKKYKDPPFNASFLKIIGLISLSLFLPPIGLWPGFKLLFNSDRKAQLVGIILILITIVATGVSIWLTIGFINSQISSIQTQTQTLQQIG